MAVMLFWASMCACFPQVNDQQGIGNPTEYTLIVPAVDVGFQNSYLFTSLSLEVRLRLRMS